MPAAVWAAKSGDAVLFTERDALPARDPAGDQATRAPAHLRARARARDLVVRRSARCDASARVKRIAGPHAGRPTRSRSRATPTRPSAGECATRATASCSRTRDRPRDAAAAAALGGSGKYGPLLLLDGADELPRPLENYLLDIQPGYRFDPVRGVYNHAWMMGDESAISLGVQARIDELTEIVRVRDEDL